MQDPPRARLAGVSEQSIAFDRAADYYDATRGYPPEIAHRVAETLADAGQLRADQRLLEIGVGTGRIALPLSRYVAGIVGVDLATPMLQRLLDKRSDEPVGAVRADVCRLPFADGTFDAAVSMHIFHLIPHWRLALGELARVLRPGAVFLEADDGYPMRGVWDAVNARLPWYRSNLAAGHIPEDFPRLAGFESVEPAMRFEYLAQTHLPTVLQHLRARVWSSTWRLTDAQLVLLADTFEEAASAHYGGTSATVADPRHVAARIYRLPSSVTG